VARWRSYLVDLTVGWGFGEQQTFIARPATT
jgi:hypothetical protein